MTDEDKWKRRLERERAARQQAERLLEEKSLELFEANQRLEEKVVVESSKFHREEVKFKALFNSSADGILLNNPEGNIILANQALCNLLRVQHHEIIGKPLWDFFKNDAEILELAKKASKQLDENGATRFDCKFINADGKEISCEVSATRFEIEGEVVSQGIIRDISERVRAAEVLKEASKAAIQANEAKSMFLATMSHEIRTPLNGIIGFTDLMLEENENEVHDNYLNLIKKSGGMLLNIINDILDFSKIESRQIELEEMDYSLQECIEATMDIHANTAAQKNVELLYDISDDVQVGLRGDMGRLQQVLLNLVSNALKFTDSGSVSIKVENASKKFLEISVKDTGIGFDEKLAEKLFTPFQQEDASTTRKYGGTGLGLAICKELIETMGGSIQAKSVIGEGSTFSLLLPSTRSKGAIIRHAESFDISWMTGLRALVVDDNELNLEFMRARLGKWGMIVQTVLSGHEALRVMEEDSNYDILFLDMLMPEMDGIELAEHLIRIYAKALPPLMLVTSARLAGDKQGAKDQGFSSVVYKPVHERELILELKRILRDEDRIIPSQNVQKNKVESTSASYALLVEDNPINAKLATIMVERMGVKAHVAHNGQEALDALRLKPIYEVVLMDMQMPVMDGVEATERIRAGEAGEAYKEIPIIAMTANAMRDQELKCLEAGMNSFTTKPINAGILKETLTEYGVIKG